MTEDNTPHQPSETPDEDRFGDAPEGSTSPSSTVPTPPPSPDIPVPVPGGPAPTPEVPDIPEIPETPEIPGAVDTPEPSPAPVEPMPVVTPNPRPVPMPTVNPGPRVSPMPTVTPRPVQPSTPEPPAEAAAMAPPAVATPEVDAVPTGDSEPADATPADEPIATDPSTEDIESTPTGDSEPVQADQAGAAPEAEPETAPAPASEPASAESAPAAAPSPGHRQQGQRQRGGRPGGGKPGGRPSGRPSPVPSAHVPTAVVEPIVEAIDPHLWGRIDDDGVVYVTTAAGERTIGNWQAGDNEAGLAHFGRKFDDFSTEIALLEARLASGTGDPKATKTQAIALRESVENLAAIGDLDNAAVRLEIVIGAADAAIAGASHARTAARNAAIKAKEALCVEAEELAESTQWKSTGDRLKAIVEEWRAIRGIDRKTDDALWKRFAKARDTFTRHRGSHFAELDKQRGAAREAKEALIAKAEALSDATDWGETAGAYRELMEEWKAVGRAPRDVEDALWARFRAAQEKFFSRRNKTFSDRDAEFEANAKVKEQLLAEAEKIDPATGLDAAKAKMRSIQERWEAAGKVPRERIREFDTRLRAVEDKLKTAEDRHWRRTDPETSARVAQFQARVDSYRTQAAKARAAGDERKARDADAQAKQWEEWLRTAQSAVE